MKWICKDSLNCPQQQQQACGYNARQLMKPCVDEINKLRRGLRSSEGGKIVVEQTAKNYNARYERGGPADISVLEVLERDERCRISGIDEVVPENPFNKVIQRGKIVNGRFLSVS